MTRSEGIVRAGAKLRGIRVRLGLSVRDVERLSIELAKNRRLEDIAASLAFEVCYFNLSEFMKGGALLSCMAMHLNRNSYSFALTT